MSKISNTTVYPNIIPTANDYVVLTDVNDSNETKTSTVSNFQKFFGVTTMEVTLSSAQILSCTSNPIELIPPPGAGKYIIPFGSMVLKTIFNTTGYLWNASGAGIIQPGPPIVDFLEIPYGDLNGAVVDETYIYSAVDDLLAGNELTGAVNQGVFFAGFAANPTLGDGTIKISLQYRIVEL